MDKVRKDMFIATKDGDNNVKNIAQQIMSVVKNAEIDLGESLKKEKVIELIRTEVKKLKEAIEQFNEADRDDLSKINEAQVEYLDQYLPQLMSAEEIAEVVKAKAMEVGAESVRDMGKLMGAVMAELKGKADGGLVKDAVSAVLK